MSGPTVFISYAHENDALRAAVKALADWLAQRGCTVLTDHLHIYRPPPEGWQAWMLACIARADVVLVVCTPMLKARYEKTASPDSGRGATYEGSIVTQHIYDAAMRNTKFFPILPEAGAVDDVPTFLKPWFNGHRFPSGYEGIRCMIFDAPPDADGAASAGAARPGGEPQSIRTAHARLTTKLLDAAGALPFFRALQDEFADEFPQIPIPPATASEMVQRFEDCPAEQVQQLFYVVRRSLLTMPPHMEPGGQRQAEEAAAALYFLAACRLVDREVHAAGVAASGACAYVLHVPRSEHVICAVIATALFGGELRLEPGSERDLPAPEGVFEVKVPAGGDQIAADFERAAYVALFANDRTTTEVGLDAGPLTPDQRKALAARIRTIRNVRKRSMTLVVPSFTHADACEGFADTHRLPVMLPATEATTALLGMDVDTLLAEIREFWNELDVSKRADPQAHSRPPGQTSPGVQSMPSPRVDLHISGGTPNISISTGDHSATQSGTGHSAHVEHREGADLAALTPILQQLAQAIGELPSAKARDTLTAHVQAAQAEAGKPGKPDPGLIQRALDQIKPAAEALDHGEKVVALCARAYQALAPYLGLPPSP